MDKWVAANSHAGAALFVDGTSYPYTHYKHFGSITGYNEACNGVIPFGTIWHIEVINSIDTTGMNGYFRRGEWVDNGNGTELHVYDRLA